MKNFEKQCKLIDLAIASGNIKAAKKMAVKSVDNFVRLSKKLKGVDATYYDIREINQGN